MSDDYIKRMTQAEWFAEAFKRFGDDVGKWAFECPACHHVATVDDWHSVGAAEGEIGFSCVGRRMPKPREAFVVPDTKGQTPKGPCNYAGGGLFRLNPVEVTFDDGQVVRMMAFANP